ncbi:hypothetical protein [uncultured Sphingomonas sp.]|uniref:hypothetical protein n=1 Tax=uncultured Sphingomonas sp. TaxID=158754 RepID=UPI0035CB8DF2
MKRVAMFGAFALAALCPVTGACAQQALGSVTIGVTGGTEGVGPELSYRIDHLIGVRANATFLGFGHTVRSDGIEYHGHADLQSGGVMLDLYPFRGGFFLSGGARLNGNHGQLSGTPTQNTRIGNDVFTPAQIGTISGRGETKNFAPQATLGYVAKVGSHFTLGFEAGALFQGAVHIQDFQSDGTLAANALYMMQLDQERRNVQSDVDGYKVYPIAQLRFGYRF